MPVGISHDWSFPPLQHFRSQVPTSKRNAEWRQEWLYFPVISVLTWNILFLLHSLLSQAPYMFWFLKKNKQKPQLSQQTVLSPCLYSQSNHYKQFRKSPSCASEVAQWAFFHHRRLSRAWTMCSTGGQIYGGYTDCCLGWILQLDMRKKFLHGRGCQILEQVVRGSSWVTIPARIEKMCRCGTQEHG